MKIESIESIRVSIPFETRGKRQGMRPGLTPRLKMESFMVRVETDERFNNSCAVQLDRVMLAAVNLAMVRRIR